MLDLLQTAVVREDDRYITKAMCLARMDIALGGRAAEELIYGVNKITANAADDLDVSLAALNCNYLG